MSRAALIAALSGACLTFAAPAASALTGRAAVAALNALRGANGIPADLTERADWTAACAAHNRYMQLNGVLVKDEDPHLRGYSAQGVWAARHAAVARDTWTPTHNPWERVPVDLMALLSPRLTQLGISGTKQHVCATTTPGYLRPAPSHPSLYPYPGDGAGAVPFEQWSFGTPFTPGDFVGLPAGFVTGPNLLVMADIGGRAQVTGASLAGPGGPVALRTVDNATDAIGPLLPTGAVLIPVSPLQPGATYVATANLNVDGVPLSRRWSFSTQLADPHTLLFVASFVRYDARTHTITQGNVAAKTSSPAPIHVTISGGGQTVGTHDLGNGDSWIPPQVPGTFQVCAHQEPTSYYRGYDGCQVLRIRDQASFSHRTKISIKARFVGRYLRYKLVVTPALKRKVTLRARRLVGGHWHTFRTVTRDANRVLTRQLTARPTDRAVQVVLTIPRIRDGADVYEAARLVKTIHR